MKKQLVVCVIAALVVFLSACGALAGETLTFRTADPGLSIALGLLPAPLETAEPTAVPTEEPTEEPILPTVTPTPAGCVDAKGNISATGEKIYHCPGQANYNNVKIDKDGEAIFATEQEAIDAGFRRALR